ncbi:MAG: aldo/keto reductase [Nitratireductor sp.]|uniref:aldo/keto reductase n=1 Tax=Parvibaculum sp. TaxID=2024848 RepID=UPI003271126D
MKASEKKKFGRTGLEVTAMGFGTAPLGNQFRVVPEEDAREVIKGAWDAGLRYFDTAPVYGHGLSEHRLGESLRGRPRDEYVLSTKVGRLLKPVPSSNVTSAFWEECPPFEIVHDYSYDGVMRSFEDSIQRLGVGRIDILFIHDIDTWTHGEELQKQYFRTAMDSGYKALETLRSQGVVSAIGVGCNEWQVCEAALRERDFDCFLLAGRYTLLEQDALDTFLPLCEERDVAIVLGGGFNSGILATGAIPGAHYNYAEAEEPVLEHVRKIEAVCKTFDVPLKAAALQFVLAHPSIPTNIPGTRTRKHLDENIGLIGHAIPSEFWSELKKQGLVRENAPTPS